MIERYPVDLLPGYIPIGIGPDYSQAKNVYLHQDESLPCPYPVGSITATGATVMDVWTENSSNGWQWVCEVSHE